jgi:hypothetical protein
MWKGNPHAELIFVVLTLGFTLCALGLLAWDSWRVFRRYLKSRKDKGQ